jgi:hypothetical protein
VVPCFALDLSHARMRGGFLFLRVHDDDVCYRREIDL